MAFKNGYAAKLYRSTALITGTNTPAAATWDEIPGVRDVDQPDSRTELEITTRANNGFKAYGVGLRDMSFSFEMMDDDDDTDFTAIETAYDGGTEIGLARMDKAIATTGSTGIAGNFVVTSMARSEALDDVQKVTFTFKPSSFVQRYTKAP